ncbi:hypothetical protein D9757_006482 [Collybiopsis confluens]|uniref:Uncharacterized protein n=1 Tax=Collybiopsis confluens TaxID=2823264 RepID=A0A8H5HJN4_9AGAR|nr:hypothetical protein D9757_006482 [Collybiopsis confluens]
MQTPSTAIPRLVVVDDTDPAIQYSPPSAFSLDSDGTLDELGYGGPVWNKTVTGTTTNSSLSYTFNGTFVRVLVATQGNDSHWNCSVDGHLLPSFNSTTTQVTNSVACDSQGLLHGLKGPHTISVNVSFTPQDGLDSGTIWLDSVQYEPLPEDPLDSVMLRVHNSDPAVKYDNSTGGWAWQGVDSNATHSIGTTANFAFNGTSASLYSVIFGASNNIFNASSALFTIDGNSSSNVPLPGSVQIPSVGTYYNRLNYPLFTVPNLSESLPHNLQLAYAYSGNTNPQYLALDYFMIQTNPTHSLTSTSSDQDVRPHNNIGPIVGVVLGAVVGLAACILLFFYFRRRRRTSYSGMTLDLTGNSPGYYRLQDSAGGTLEVTPFVSPDVPPGNYRPTKYASDTGYTGQPSGANAYLGDAGSRPGTQGRLSGWNPDRFIMSKRTPAQALTTENDRSQRNEGTQHLDSGVRLSHDGGGGQEEGEAIGDVPPIYTES